MEDDDIIGKGLQLIEEAEQQGLHMRLLGAVAIRIHSPEYNHLFKRINRPITDIDFIALRKHNIKIQDFMTERGYEPDPAVMRYFGHKRHIYQQVNDPLKVDVFFDTLSFCHEVDFRKRIVLDYPTITVTDILLEKMQIVEINAKDLYDTIILLREHALSPEETRETVNTGYLSSLLGNDWGYWYTVTRNLAKVKEHAFGDEAFHGEDADIVAERIDALLKVLDECHKTIKWKARAILGTRVKWYTEVEEVNRDVI